MHTVFLSHAHADNLLCDRYVAALRERRLDVWYDRTNMQVGHSLSADIEAELQRRTAFVLIATPASLASAWVRTEVNGFRYLASQDPTRLFVPVRAVECEMPLLMRDVLWVDAVTDGFEAAIEAIAIALGAERAAQRKSRPYPRPGLGVGLEALVEAHVAESQMTRSTTPVTPTPQPVQPPSSTPQELVRTRYTDGWLVLTDTAIRVERKGFLGAGGKLDVLPRVALRGATMENKIASIAGHGGATTLTFTGMGKQIVAKMVKPADAQRIMQLLGFA
jgi:hypothetical protein